MFLAKNLLRDDGVIFVVGAYGPGDHSKFLVDLNILDALHPSIRIFRDWGLHLKNTWNIFVTKGRVLVLVDCGKTLVGITVHEGGIEHAYDDSDMLVPESDARDMFGGTLPFFEWLAAISVSSPNSFRNLPVHSLARQFLEPGEVVAADQGLVDLMFEWTHESLAKGQTPTGIMSYLRRMAPERYDREFGDGGIAADMGDMGF